ncbi:MULTISPECIES: hypothetical protein [unclassified Candidatus Tisiphia]|uniref:hypothetical protein n=1 Tax=unclassified Candidatus Tisiphia TaxID=2996318 RepID=UPI00312CB6E0
MVNSFYTREEILFKYNNHHLFTRLGDIEAQVFFTKTSWTFRWERFCTRNKCEVNYWCENNHCSLDDLDTTEYCNTCPQYVVEDIEEQAFTENQHTLILQPTDIEEVRQNILHDYQSLSHNGLNNQYLYRILHGKWNESKD